MESKGADVLQGHYDYKTATFQSLSQEDQYRPIVTDATAAYLTATNQRKYQNITLYWKIPRHTSTRAFTDHATRSKGCSLCLADTPFQ
jgi:hypothetical protein